MVLNERKSNFITYRVLPGIYTFKDHSEILLRKLQSEFEEVNNTVDFHFHDTSMKTKLVVRPGNIAMKFDEKIVFSSILGFNPHWDYKQNNECNSQNFINLGKIDEIHLKCDDIDESVVN